MTNRYYCNHCGKIEERESNKKWIKSYCDKTGKDVHMKLYTDPIRIPMTHEEKIEFIKINFNKMPQNRLMFQVEEKSYYQLDKLIKEAGFKKEKKLPKFIETRKDKLKKLEPVISVEQDAAIKKYLGIETVEDSEIYPMIYQDRVEEICFKATEKMEAKQQIIK